MPAPRTSTAIAFDGLARLMSNPLELFTHITSEVKRTHCHPASLKKLPKVDPRTDTVKAILFITVSLSEISLISLSEWKISSRIPPTLSSGHSGLALASSVYFMAVLWFHSGVFYTQWLRWHVDSCAYVMVVIKCVSASDLIWQAKKLISHESKWRSGPLHVACCMLQSILSRTYEITWRMFHFKRYDSQPKYNFNCSIF